MPDRTSHVARSDTTHHYSSCLRRLQWKFNSAETFWTSLVVYCRSVSWSITQRGIEKKSLLIKYLYVWTITEILTCFSTPALCSGFGSAAATLLSQSTSKLCSPLCVSAPRTRISEGVAVECSALLQERFNVFTPKWVMNIHSPAALIGTPLIYARGSGTVHSMAQLQVNQLQLMFTSNIRTEGEKVWSRWL